MGGDDDMDDLDDLPSSLEDERMKPTLKNAVKDQLGKAEHFAKQATKSVKSSVKGAWEKAKNMLGMGEEENLESQFSEEELAKEEL